jgi:hypothetical protein
MSWTSNNFVYPLSNPVLGEFCLRILPKIHYQIKSLYLESLSMERILATNYPNLSQLGLFNPFSPSVLNIVHFVKFHNL